MGILDLFQRRKKDDEQERRLHLLRTGRITEGTIFDVGTDEAGHVTHIFFSYSLNGVNYEASEALDEAQRQRFADYLPGARITVRYHPHQPGNSVVV